MRESQLPKQSLLTQIFLGLLLFALAIAVYQQTWRAGFIWDDDVYLTKNPLITAPDGLKRIWFSLDSPSQYFPLVYSVFRMEYALWGFNPLGYHAVNVVLHALNALLLWRLLRVLHVRGAWLGASLFALHPVQVESVAWITELKNVLMGFFFLLTLWCWVRSDDKETGAKATAYYLAALFCYILALAGKSTACTLPAALVLILWLKHKTFTLRRILLIAPFVALAGAMGTLTIWWERFHQGTQGRAFEVGWLERLLIASRAFWFYLGKLIWPHPLSFSYPRWVVVTNELAGYLWLGLFLVAVIVVYFLRPYTKRSLETALVFFLVTLGPVLGFIMLWTFRYSWVADHYQYLACIGPLAFVAANIDRAVVRYSGVKIAVTIVILGTLGLTTWQQSANYLDAETLWRATLSTNPGSGLAHNSLGVLIGERGGSIDEEIAHYQMAIESDPNDAEAHNNLGYAFARQGRADEALEEYRKSLAADPRYLTAHGNLATLLLERGEADAAIAELKEISERGPGNAALEHSLGNLLARLHRMSEAIAHWQHALELHGDNSALQASVGQALAATGDMNPALPYLRTAAELSPENARNHFNYASALSLLGRFTEAIPEYKAALRLQPDLSEAHLNLAICYLQSEQLEDAVAEYEQFLKLRPDDLTAQKDLAVLLRSLRRDADAEGHEKRASEVEGQR